jgi:hypothetical protein
MLGALMPPRQLKVIVTPAFEWKVISPANEEVNCGFESSEQLDGDSVQVGNAEDPPESPIGTETSWIYFKNIYEIIWWISVKNNKLLLYTFQHKMMDILQQYEEQR